MRAEEKWMQNFIESVTAPEDAPDNSKPFIATEDGCIKANPDFDSSLFTSVPYPRAEEVTVSELEEGDLLYAVQGIWSQAGLGFSGFYGSAVVKPDGTFEGVVLDNLGVAKIVGEIDETDLVFDKNYFIGYTWMTDASTIHYEFHRNTTSEPWKGGYAMRIGGGSATCSLVPCDWIPGPCAITDMVLEHDKKRQQAATQHQDADDIGEPDSSGDVPLGEEE